MSTNRLKKPLLIIVLVAFFVGLLLLRLVHPVYTFRKF